MAAEKKISAAPKGKAARRRLTASPKAKQPSRALLEVAEEFWHAIPESERDNVPHDGSINHKHYLCGHLKRTLEA